MDYNKAIVVGNLTRDPELKSMPSGDNVVNVAIATNRKWKDKQGQKIEEVEFHNVVIFGKMAETVAQYMTKGSEMLVEGRLKTSSWEQDGVKKYKTEIVAENVKFGSKKENSSSYKNPASQQPTDTPPPSNDNDDINIDQIPW
jgi:single-strand DNA-binding protein